MSNGNNILISVVMPIYKSERFLSDSLDSLIGQSYTNWEAVCVNDSSPDNSAEILSAYASKDSRIRIITQKNGGVSSARNTALDAIRGEYVTFLDPDDVIASEWLKTTVTLAAAHSPDLVSLSHKEVSEDFSLSSIPPANDIDISKTKVISGKNECTSRIWSGNDYLNCGIYKTWKTSVIKDVRFNEKVRMGEDTMFIWSAAPNLEKIVELDFKGYFYRRHPSSVMSSPRFGDSMNGWHNRTRKIYELMKTYEASGFSHYPLYGFTSYIYHILKIKISGWNGPNIGVPPSKPGIWGNLFRRAVLRLFWLTTLPWR